MTTQDINLSAKPARGTFTGRHMLLLSLGFFGVIISANVGLAVVSATSWTGLVVDNSYVASQEFDLKRDAHLKQAAAGWTSIFSIEESGLRLNVVDGAGKPVDLGTVKVLVARPVGGHDDQRLTLERGPDGAFAAPITLSDGVWDVWITADTTPLGFYELHERAKLGLAEGGETTR